VLSTKEEPKTKAEAFGLGANDYLVKLPDKIELIARIRHHSKGYISLLQRNAAYQALEASQAALAKELHEAAAYVRSILPKPLTGAITTNWRFISSSSLGGDAFGYHWLDDNHFALYLLDVCGHGVGAALLSISAINVLRAQSLPATDFRNPGQVLAALSEAFEMEKQNDMYFTMWYGVFEKNSRGLVYSSGGHPPAVLIGADQPGLLRTGNPSIGTMPGITFQSGRTTIPAGAKLYLFSDGTYELTKTSGGMLMFAEFVEELKSPLSDGSADLDRIIEYGRQLSGQPSFEDDFSMVRFDFA
jgi:sigma-B regulation protein RsbU (phosphoserine phosphatase)